MGKKGERKEAGIELRNRAEKKTKSKEIASSPADSDDKTDDIKLSKTKARKEAAKKRAIFIAKHSGTVVVFLILLYGCWIARTFYKICYPDFETVDEDGTEVTFVKNAVKPGTKITARVFIGDEDKEREAIPVWDFNFTYEWGSQSSREKLDVPITINEKLLSQVKKKKLILALYNAKNDRQFASAEGSVIKYIEKKEEKKYNLLLPLEDHKKQADACPVKNEPVYEQSKENKWGETMHKEYKVRGLPKMQIRLVYDESEYPYYFFGSTDRPYLPQAFVDEFWLTDDQLVVFDQEEDMSAKKSGNDSDASTITTTTNSDGSRELSFNVSIYFDLMSAPRWRFQRTMEHNLANVAKTFGEDSEEILQMRDLFANTSASLLICTLIVSILHMIFEFLAFKSDVQFWNAQTPEVLNKYVSVRSVMVNIVFEAILLLYLWDQSANVLVLVFSLMSIAIECWKVTRAMTLKPHFLFGFIPVPAFVSKVEKKTAVADEENYDWLAMKYIGSLVLPVTAAYAFYNIYKNCHKGWYSYFIETAASCVYGGGFVLMTPQLFINYKFKTVAYLPWKRFIYRALNTFVDDLFSFIIRMPTMHRLGCFRDDIVFFIYLYQRRIYPEDKNRAFDDDGEEVVPTESKKSK